VPKILTYSLTRQCGLIRGMSLKCETSFTLLTDGAVSCPNIPATVICLKPDQGLYIRRGGAEYLSCCVGPVVDGESVIPRYVVLDVNISHNAGRCIPGCCEFASRRYILEWDEEAHNWQYWFDQSEICNSGEPCFEDGHEDTTFVRWLLRCSDGNLLLTLRAFQVGGFADFPIYEVQTSEVGPRCFSLDPDEPTQFVSQDGWPCQTVSVSAYAYTGT